MSAEEVMEMFARHLGVVPSPGHSNQFIIRPQPNLNTVQPGSEMTEEDWDKFEADINEAFEKVP